MSDMGMGGPPPTGRPLVYESNADAYGGETDTARAQAVQVAQDATESGRQVAGTAAHQGRNVAQEGRRQVQELSRQVGQQVDEQSRMQKDKAASGLRSLADELTGMAVYGHGGVAAELANQAASKAQDAAGWLDRHEPGQLVDEVRDFARRKPGTFLLGALAVGVVAGRLTRGAVDAARSDDDDETLARPSAAGAGSVPSRSGVFPEAGPDLSTEAGLEPTPLEPGYRTAAGGGYR